MVGPTFTPNLHLTKLPANYRVWSQIMNDNLTMMDAAISGFITFNNLRGGWANSTAYALSDTVVDTSTAVIYSCLVAHTSAAIPTTFAQDRIAHPTYWSVAAAAASARGAWATATAYNRNDFVLADGTKYAFCLVAHTSGANFATDLALGRWSVLIDLSTVGSLVLPVLSGAGDANKLVMTNSGGTNYIINAISTFLGLVPSTGALGNVVFSISPTLTGNPIAPTQAVEANDTKIATDAYVDRAARAMVIRMQTFSVSGTYTPNAKMVYCIMKAWGAGGGSGGSPDPGAGSTGAAGGGAGGFSLQVASLATIGASQVITIGAGGTAGAAGSNPGGNGGDTSIGALCIAKGGSGGPHPVSVGITLGGVGGIAGTGAITGTGMSGGAGVGMAAGTGQGFGGQGGSTLVGGGGRSTAPNSNGIAGQGFGSGASGACAAGGLGAPAGAVGGGGFVSVIEFCYG